MSKGPMPLSFSSSEERDKWIIKNCDYFTAVRRVNLQTERYEFPSLDEAEAAARRILNESGGKPFMIYAVSGIYSAFVKGVAK